MNLFTGWHTAVQHLNQYPENLTAELCQEVIALLQYSKGQIDVENFTQSLQSCGVDCSTKSVQEAANVLTCVFRHAAESKLDPEKLKSQLRDAVTWSESTVAIVIKAWSDQKSHLISVADAYKALNVGKLVDFKWKLGLAMSSSSCKNLNSPYIVVSMKIASPSGEVQLQSFEMTVPEFKHFSKQMKDMAAVMETV
ncbi:COMM domain-containing protein 6 [Holothuria leucospilota]|uniref:COMM domain-containing protein 6 n=1 Tax=Holothuria leucospilota TaxID=206669 RepID=A0A9Q1BLB7_HOLLE|nr:COMM domain-containing protein 6 [Holothuria leucospilota]